MKKTILIVDDQIINRKILKKLLNDDYTIIEATNGQDALDCLHHGDCKVSAILLDLIMPVMNGYEMLGILMNDTLLRNIPVIVASQADRTESELKALELGARDYIEKPYHPLILKKRLSNLIELYESGIHIGRLKEEMLFDKMTGIYNRAALTEKIEMALHENTTADFLLFMIDVDDFKEVNDNLGHDIGDKVVCKVASILKSLFREQDCVCRMGGDEFAVFMQAELSQEEIIKRLQMMQNKLQLSEAGLDVTCSIGVCSSPKDGISYETLYRNADQALYTAKSQGKNCYAIYSNVYI